MIRFDCVTLFPEMFAAVTESGITRRALEEQRRILRAFGRDKDLAKAARIARPEHPHVA